MITLERRRPAKRARSRSTVESILVAAREQLEQSGYAALTTHAIAERAGVNIASLYRYFPNRESIVVALYEEATMRIVLRMKAALAKVMPKKVAEAFPYLVRVCYELHLENEAVIVRLRYQAPELFEGTTPYDMVEQFRLSTMAYIERYRPEMRISDMQTALYFAANNVIANIHNYIMTQPAHIPVDVFVEELACSVIAYLQFDPRQLRRSR